MHFKIHNFYYGVYLDLAKDVNSEIRKWLTIWDMENAELVQLQSAKTYLFFLRASTGTYRTDRNITRLLQYYSLPTMWMSEWPPFLWPPRLELFPCSVWPHFPEGNKCPQCTQLVVAFPLPVLLWRDLYQIAWVTFLSGPLRPRTESFLPKVCRHKWFPANPAFHGHARPSFSPLCPLQHSSGCRVQYMCDHKSYCKFPYLVQNEGSSGEGEKGPLDMLSVFFFLEPPPQVGVEKKTQSSVSMTCGTRLHFSLPVCCQFSQQKNILLPRI
jgi:hypothetical protein